MSYNNIVPVWLVELETIESGLEQGMFSKSDALLYIEKSAAPKHVKTNFIERLKLDV